MADYYCDHGYYLPFTTTPTWANGGAPDPVDGDGLSTGTAVCAQATIDFTGITAAAGNTIGICGATLTCVASGAAANQFNAGSGTTLAANVASAINAATSAVSKGASTGQPQLRMFAYARVKSGAANVVEICTRAGSALYNYAYPNAAMAITSSGMTAPTITQFAGGASGPWGYLWNTTGTFGPSSLAIGVYGLMGINGNATGRLLAGPASLTQSDMVWVRCNNRDVNPAATVTLNIVPPVNVTFDGSNVKWGDTSGKTFKIRNTGTTIQLTINWNNTAAATGEYDNYMGATVMDCAQIVNETVGTGANAHLILANGPSVSTSVWLDRMAIRDQSVSSFTYIQNSYQVSKSKNWYVEGCKFSFSRSDYTRGLLEIAGSLAGTVAMVFEGCDFNFDALSTAHPGLLNCHGASADGAATFKLVNCRASAAVAVAPFQRRSNLSSGYSCYASNLTGFKLPAAYAGLFSAFSAARSVGGVENGYSMNQNIGPKKAFRLETNSFVTDWIPDQGYPTLRSTLPDGTYWSLRTVWSASTNHYSGPAGIECMTLDKRAPNDVDATRTITLEGMMQSSNLALAKNTDIDIIVTYTASDGTVNMQRTYPAGGLMVTGTALSTSTQPWTKNSFGDYSAFKISLTTTKQVAKGTDINVSLYLHTASPNGSSSAVFIDPEVDIV